MAERPLYTLYKNLKAQNYDVPDDYNKFESALTRDGNGGADNRHAIYENLKAQNFDVPNTYERFYSALFEPRSKTSSRAKGGSVPMTAADRARFSAGAAAISASANNAVRQAKRNIQSKLGQAKKFNGGRVAPHLKNPLQNQNVQKNEFNYNATTGKTGTYTTTDGVEFDNEYDASQYQNKLDKYGEEWNNAVDMGIVPSELDMADPDLSDTDVAMRQMERRQEWLNENQDRRSKELNESMHLQGSPFVASGGAVAPSSFNTAISNEANRLSDVEYGAYNTAKAYNQMLRTTLLQELKEQKQRNENAGWLKDKWNDVSNYFGAMFNTMLDPKLYSQGVMDAAIANNLLQVKKGMEDGTIKKGSNAGNAAQAMLGAIQQQQGEAAKQQQYGTKAYLYGDMSGRSLKFMGDFASSGWRNVMTTGFTKAGEKVGEKMALGALGKWFTKNTGRVLGDMAGSAALAATNQLGSTYNNVIERYVGMNNENGGVTQDKNGDLKFNEGVSLGKAIKDGFGSATIENFSEMFGEYLPRAPKLLSKLGLSKVSAFFEKIGNNAYYKWLSNATDKSGIQGVMAEISEEEFGTALHAAWGDGDGSWSDFNVFTNPDAREKQIDTCLGMFYSVGFMQAPRTAVGAINAVKYFNIKHQVAKADKFGQVMFNDKWDEVKSKIDVTTNADLTKTVLDATRSDSMTAKQKGAVINYAMFLSKLRGFNQASDAKIKDKVEEGDTAPTLSNDLDDAYTEGHNADDADKHNIQLEQNDKANELAAMLHITPEQLHDMADEDLETMTGQDDKLDKAIYDYQVSTAKYQGVMDGAQDEVDMAAHQAAMETDNMTDLSRGTVRKATIKATGGLEDYEVYIISGNIATHDDGSIDVGNSDDMIIYYDPTTGRKEHADAMMFADLIEELPAADVKAQAVADAKENSIKKIAGIVDGAIDVGSQFSVTDADGTEHTYEVLADNGDGTAMITIDGNVPTELVKGENVQIPYSFADLQQLKDAEDLKRLEAAKTQREQMEKERAAQQTQSSFDFKKILNDNGNVVLADVIGKDGNTKYPNSKLFLIRNDGAKAKVVELKSDGSLKSHAVNKEDVVTTTSISLDEYKQAVSGSSVIEDNSGSIEADRGGIEADRGGIEVENNKEGKLLNRNDDGAQTEQNQPSASVTTSQEDAAGSSESKDTNISANGNENNERLTFEDGTPIPVDVNGEVDLSQTDAAHAAEWYDTNLGEDADGWLDGEINKAKKVLDQAKNRKLTGTKPSELVASKKEKEAAIADAQARYDSAISIRDSLKERRIAKEENTPEGRKNLIEKARRKFSRLKSAVKDDAEAVSQLYKDVVGSLLHRLYDGTGIDVTDTIPLTAEEYVASNLGAHSLNYEGTETSKGVKQETGLSREDFAKTQLLAADGKGTTIDDLVHSLWENRPSNLESLDTQDIRNAFIGVLTSGFKASEARNYIENLRIAQAENILEEQKKAAENAAFAEENKAESEQQTETAPESEEKTGEDNSDEINDEENEQTNAPEQNKFPDKLRDGSKAIEVPEDATDEKPLGEQRTKSPFLVRENGKQQTETESAADVEKNKVDDMKVVGNIVGQKTRKTLEKIARIMGSNIQWLYSNEQFNGKFDEQTNTIYITLDSSITEGVQFIFGHEMTHEMRTKNPAAYEELKVLVKNMMGEDVFSAETDKMQKRYKEGGARYWNNRDAIEEEVVADQLGKWIRDANYAHTLLLKMSHPLLARLHEIVNRFLMALHGTEFSDDMYLILRSIEQAYVKTANGQVTNSETGEDVSFSLRQKPEPKKKGVGYKVFVLKDGKLYPPMVANPDGAATPVGVWLDADAAPIAGESKTGRPQVKQGGKGTQGGSGKLAYRPGWHLGVVPYAIQFNRKDADGNKTLFPKNFVFAEVEYAADVDYQEEARQEGINPSGKYQHSLAGLKHLPTDGYYMYRTNPNPETDPWVITGAMKVNRILTRAEQADLVSKAGREPQQIQEGDIVTDDVVNSINQEIAAAPKFSLKVYHGSGADFTEFDFDHMGEGAGSQVSGWGGYVTSSKKIGKSYATLMDNDPSKAYYRIQRSNGTRFAKKYPTLESFLHGDKQIAMNDKFTEQEKIDFYNEMKKLAEPYHNLYEVDIPDDNGSNYLDWEGTIPDSLDKQKMAEDAYKVVSDNQGFNDFKATPLNDFIAHTLKTYVNTTDVAGRVEKLKSDIKDVIENYVADDDVLALNEYLKDATPDDVLATIWYNDLVRDIKDADLGEELYRKLSTYVGDKAASQILSDNGLVGIKYPAGIINGGAKEGDYNYVIFDENNANIVGNTRFSLRYDQFEHDLNQWKKDNNLPKDAQRPTIPQRNAGESAVDFLRRVDEYRKQMALWKTAPTYEQHLLSDDTALGEFNRELQKGSVLKRIAFQDSMLAIRKAQEAIMKEVGVDRLNMAEDAYTAENRSHGKGKNEFEEYNNEFLQPLRKAYHQMKKVLGDSYDNVRVYMMAKHGLERDAQMAFKKSLDADYEDVNQRSAAYKAYKNDLDRVSNDADLEFGRVDFTTWRQKDNALRGKYSPSYMDYRYDDNGIAYDYSGLSSLFDGSDFEEAAHKLVRDVETKHLAEVQALWNAANAATKKILRDGFKAGMMSKDAYEYVKGMYSHYIPLRGWDGTTADQVWDYIGGGKGAFNQTLKTAHGRTSIADDPIAYIENMAESGILLNNKNWVKQHLMLLAQNHPTSLITLSKAWYVKSTDANGNEEWIPATPQITSQMNSNQVKAAIDAFEQKMEQLAQTGDATQQRDGLNIAYPQTHSEEREHEVRVMKDGEEYVIYVNGDPQLAQAMNNTRAHRVREIQSGKLDRSAAWLGRKMAAAYTSLSPLFIPSNYFRDLTMTLASTAIREDAKYNYLLRKNLATSWNLGFILRDYQNGKLRDKVNNGNATSKEQMFYDFMMNGGETGFVSSLDVEDLKKKFKNDLKDLDRWKANPVKVGHTIMDGIEFLNRMIEDSNRFAVYMTSIQYGRSIDEAVNDAKDVTLNFNRKGTGEYGWQMIRNLYLFINPAVQSLQTLGALAKHHPFKFTAVTAAWLASGVLVPIVNAALMSLLGGDDDKDKYWQFTKWDRRNNLIMWVPFTNEFVKIPLAQEFRAFYGVGDMIASKMMGGELAEETWSQYAEDLLGQVVDMLPLDPTGYDGNIAVSLMPNPIRPVFELAFNVDFTGKPLFKETEYNKYDPNFTKAYVGTPDWLVRVSKMVNSIGNDYPDVQQNAIDAFGDPRYNLNNPAVVDHVLSSYLGGAYTMGSQVLGVLTKSLNDPKEIKMADIPLVSKFVSNPDDRPVTKKQGDEFWNMKENHDRAANTLSKLKKQAKVDGDYSMLERFYGSEEYKQYKQEDVKVKKYEEDKKKERAEESGEEYRPHKLNAEDIYKAHATPKDDFEDLKLKQLYTKLNGFKTSYDLLLDTAPSQSDGYYNTNKAAIDAIDEISLDKQEISELKKGFLEDGKDAYNAEDMKRIRELRKRILSVLEPADKVVVANQKAKAEK